MVKILNCYLYAKKVMALCLSVQFFLANPVYSTRVVEWDSLLYPSTVVYYFDLNKEMNWMTKFSCVVGFFLRIKALSLLDWFLTFPLKTVETLNLEQLEKRFSHRQAIINWNSDTLKNFLSYVKTSERF